MQHQPQSVVANGPDRCAGSSSAEILRLRPAPTATSFWVERMRWSFPNRADDTNLDLNPSGKYKEITLVSSSHSIGSRRRA